MKNVTETFPVYCTYIHKKSHGNTTRLLHLQESSTSIDTALPKLNLTSTSVPQRNPTQYTASIKNQPPKKAPRVYCLSLKPQLKNFKWKSLS